MDLKNYLLEYVSSGRGKKNIPVEPDTILKVGDVVRIKDEKWFDSLEKDGGGYGLIRTDDATISFTRTMTKYLGCTVEIVKSYRKFGYGEPRYKVRLYNVGNTREIEDYVFCNDMLEYI
jgi:hypothetical protein